MTDCHLSHKCENMPQQEIVLKKQSKCTNTVSEHSSIMKMVLKDSFKKVNILKSKTVLKLHKL